MKITMIPLLAAVLLASGCASIDRTGYESKESIPPIPDDKCNVKVYKSKFEAEHYGKIEELCKIEGNSSMSFVHTVEVALERAKPKACLCGADKVYIKSSKPMGWTVAEVELVAFRYVNQEGAKK